MEYEELTKLLIKISEYAKRTYRQDLTDKYKIASGKLFNSIDYRLEVNETNVKLYFVAEKYWINIEDGRKAGSKMPPISVIKRWIIQRGIVGRNGISNDSLAYLISRSIAKKGIKAQPFLRNIKKTLSEFIPEIKQALENDLELKVKESLESIKNNNKYIKLK
jgi:predicted thioredoxin/glutaredoxin